MEKAESDFDEMKPSLALIESFKEKVLSKLLDKVYQLGEMVPFSETENFTSLNDRIDKLIHGTDKKIEDARKEEELMNEKRGELDDIERQYDDISSKYAIPQDLPIAVEDVKRLQSLLNRLAVFDVSDIGDKQCVDHFLRQIDSLKSLIKV